MARQPRNRGNVPTLPPSIVSLLSVGWEGLVVQDDDPDALAPWEYSDEQLVEAYRQHRRLVDAEAQRAGREQAWILETHFWRRAQSDSDEAA
jgi:hypothetical protein